MNIRCLALFLVFFIGTAGISKVLGVTTPNFPAVVEETVLLDEEKAGKLNKTILCGLDNDEQSRYEKLYKMTLDLYDKYPEEIIRPHNTFLMLLVTLLGNPGYFASDPLSGALGWGFSIPGNLLSLPGVKWNCAHCRKECPLEDTCSLCNQQPPQSLKKLLVTLASAGSVVEAGRNGLYLLFRTSDSSLLGGLAQKGTLPLPSGNVIAIPLAVVSFAITVFNFYLLYGLSEGAIDNAKDMAAAYRHPDDYSATLVDDKRAIAEAMKHFKSNTAQGQSSQEVGVADSQQRDPVAWVQYHAQQILDITRRENIQNLANDFRGMPSAKKGALVTAATGLFLSSQLWVLLEIASVEAVVLSSILAPTASVSVGWLIAPLVIGCTVQGMTHGFGMVFLALTGYGCLGQKIAECADAFKGRFCCAGRPETEAETKPSSGLWTAGKALLSTMIIGSSLAAGWYTYNNLYPAYCLLHTIVESFTGTSNIFTPTIDVATLLENNTSYPFAALINNTSPTPAALAGLPTAGYLAACVKAGTLTPLQQAWTAAATAAYSGLVYSAIPRGKDIAKAMQSGWQRVRSVSSSAYRGKRAGFKREWRENVKGSGPNDSDCTRSAPKNRKTDDDEAIPMTSRNSNTSSLYENVP